MNIAVDSQGRWQRLKAATTSTHDRLDKDIMAAGPFQSRERYGLFVQMQNAFHREIDALYSIPVLDALLPDLEGRRRFGHTAQDLADLGMEPLAPDASPVFGTDADIPTALGWLYVAEGSNLGAAFLIKEAQKLGLSETFGARHLAAAPEGRGLHWRTFTTALDALELDESEEARMVEGAQAAFRRVHALTGRVFAA
jgi:heme oxygenase